MKLYENIVIGGYLFDLGVRMAKLRPDLPVVSVNLLQQTPSDRLLGDVLLANAAVCRLIEFKRAGKLTRKERKKLEALTYGIENSGEREEYADISRQVHWYIEIQEPRVLGYPVVSRACPYFDFANDPGFIGIHEFAGDAAEEACGEGPEPSQRMLRNAYLKWVCERFAQIEAEEREAAGAQGRRSNTSGAFMVAISEKAQTLWFAVPSIEYTLMNQRELSQAIGLRIEPDAPKYEKKMDRGYELGVGY